MVDFELNTEYELIIEGLLNFKYAVVDDFFSPSEVQGLREELTRKWEQQQFRKAAIGNLFQEQVCRDVRGDNILWIDESNQSAVEQLYFDKVNDLIAYFNRSCYMGIRQTEFHYAVYPVGTHYQRHLDVFQNDQRRCLSLVFYLNQEQWLPSYGGELALYLPNALGGEQTVKVLPLGGRLVIFDSKTLEHEVLKVAHTRFSITGWLKTN